jgi:Domain of unknown function (DUF4964)/Domain of unknown function (DUF5127)/Domain of unknown function (DUF1793)
MTRKGWERVRIKAAAMASSVAMCLSAAAQQHRAPAVPLVTNDPFFSLWSLSDKLTDTPVKHWTEVAQPITGLIRIDGKAYRWMGVMPQGFIGMPPVDAMEQTAVEITPLHSRYTFQTAGIELKVAFFTPFFPDDLEVLSRPVTYLSWNARSTDGKQHQTDLLIDVDPLIAVDQPGQQVVWTATLAPKPEQFRDLLHRLVIWSDETPSRVPTTDYYDAVSGKQMGFQARSVVGGVFIKALHDKGAISTQ